MWHRAQSTTITKTSQLTLYKDLITVYTENDIKRVQTLYGKQQNFLMLSAPVTIYYHWDLKSQTCLSSSQREIWSSHSGYPEE
jgi:hypothetical protein